jgi:hypothetical protein
MEERHTSKGENGSSRLGTENYRGVAHKELEKGVLAISNTISSIPVIVSALFHNF